MITFNDVKKLADKLEELTGFPSGETMTEVQHSFRNVPCWWVMYCYYTLYYAVYLNDVGFETLPTYNRNIIPHWLDAPDISFYTISREQKIFDELVRMGLVEYSDWDVFLMNYRPANIRGAGQ